MNVNDILKVLWHRKWMIVGALIVAIALAFGALRIITPEYRSSSTMSLSPKQLGNELLFFQTLDPVALHLRDSRTNEVEPDEAEELIDGPLADISVRTYPVDAHLQDRRPERRPGARARLCDGGLQCLHRPARAHGAGRRARDSS